MEHLTNCYDKFLKTYQDLINFVNDDKKFMIQMMPFIDIVNLSLFNFYDKLIHDETRDLTKIQSELKYARNLETLFYIDNQTELREKIIDIISIYYDGKIIYLNKEFKERKLPVSVLYNFNKLIKLTYSIINLISVAFANNELFTLKCHESFIKSLIK